MLESILIGSGFAFAAGIQPGPLQAFLLSSVARRGWRRTLPASLSPLLSDGPIALLALLVLSRLPEAAREILRAAGGVFLLYLAWAAYRQWRKRDEPGSPEHEAAPRTLVHAALVNVLNPNPYIGWSFVLGPAFLKAWRGSPANGAALLVSFYATIISILAATVLLFGTTRFLGPRGRRALILISAATLAALGIYMLATALRQR